MEPSDRRASELELQERLIAIVRATPWLLDALAIIRSLGLPDCYLAAGAIRNTVWDALHGWASLGPETDLDVVYYDPTDRQRDAEDELRAALPKYVWEVTNQATVHQWQSRAIGREVGEYASIAASIASWPETATAVGARLDERGAMQIIAPHGLSDLFELIVRPSPAAVDPRAYGARVRQKAWHVRWPLLSIRLPADEALH